MIKEIIIGLLLLHGIIHLLGFAKGFGVKDLDQFNNTISRPYGVLWLICCALFIASGIGFLIDQAWWVYIAIGSVVLSQMLIFRFWLDARMGTVVNSILVIAILIYFNVK